MGDYWYKIRVLVNKYNFLQKKLQRVGFYFYKIRIKRFCLNSAQK